MRLSAISLLNSLEGHSGKNAGNVEGGKDGQ
jgi:hypothetical protein